MGISFHRQNSSLPSTNPKDKNSQSADSNTAQDVKTKPKPNFRTRTKSFFQFPKPPVLRAKTLFASSPKNSSDDVSSSKLSSPVGQMGSTTTGRRPRFRDQNAEELLVTLKELEHPLSPEQMQILTDRLTTCNKTSSRANLSTLTDKQSDYELLSQFIDILSNSSSASSVSSNNSDEDVRTRLNNIWILSSVIRYGNNEIRDTLVKQPNLIKNLANIFANNKSGHLDEAHINFIVQLLQNLIYLDSRTMSTNLRSINFLNSLLKHIDLSPVAELLPRFIGCKSFPVRESSSILPAHKKSIAMLGTFKIQTKLSQIYIDTMNNIIDEDISDDDLNNSRKSISNEFSRCSSIDDNDYIHIASSNNNTTNNNNNNNSSSTNLSKDILIKKEKILINCSHVMAEMSSRASNLQFKYEDADERGDGFYATGLGIVTSSAYNDYKMHLDFFFYTAPVVDIWKAIFQYIDEQKSNINENDEILKMILIPGLQIITNILNVWRVSDPAHRTSTVAQHETDLSILSNDLVQFWPNLIRLLQIHDKQKSNVSTIRITIIDMMSEMISVLEEDSIFDLICGRNGELLLLLIDNLHHFKHNDLFSNCVSNIIAKSMKRFTSIDTFIKQHININDILQSFEDNVSVKSIIEVLSTTGSTSDVEDEGNDDSDNKFQDVNSENDDPNLTEWDELCMDAKTNKQCGPVLRRRRSESELAYVGEDFAQELYVMNRLQELASEDDDWTPPTDDFVGQAVDAGTSHSFRARGLSLLHLHQ